MAQDEIRKPESWELRWDEPRGKPRGKDGKRYSRNSRVTAFHGTKLKPRWDVHLSGDDDQPGFAG